LIDCWEEKKQKRRKKRYRIDLIPIYPIKQEHYHKQLPFAMSIKERK
jgi:hypothetical protein